MPDEKNQPKHIGIILDGNRRFAKRLMAKPWMGHKWGAEKVAKLFEWCKEVGVKELTLYAFSMQNFNRPKEEFDYLMNVFVEFFEDAKHNKAVHDNRICIRFIGRISLFPKEVYNKMLELMEATKGYGDYFINFAMAYGGREELIDAVKKIGRQLETGKIKAEEIDAETINRNLYMDHEPELIIRTGGDHRTSNFLVWQSWYSEWFFLEKMWPEFEKEDLAACIDDYMSRERRFGK
ncbi:di-trans,poly-cis-decaprenylcistransferase [Candidatus Woesearchaeota archaeon]|nr:di-trans,poly-cis-decaprenylcistransferase [Candidatus Woesearchaeota archaeon]